MRVDVVLIRRRPGGWLGYLGGSIVNAVSHHQNTISARRNNTMSRKRSQIKTERNVALSQDEKSLMEKKRALFIQQVHKEAQERMDELESRMEYNLAMVDKYYKIELMKMPPSLQKMRMGDLMNGLSPKEFFDRFENEEPLSSLSDVSMVVKCEADSSFAIPGPPSTRVKRASSRQKADAQTTPSVSKGGKRTLANSRSATSLRTAKTRSCVAKQSDKSKPHLRSRSVSAVGDLQLTIRSSQGKKISLTEDNVEDVDLSELDAGAVEQIQKMKRVVDFLAGKISTSKP